MGKEREREKKSQENEKEFMECGSRGFRWGISWIRFKEMSLSKVGVSSTQKMPDFKTYLRNHDTVWLVFLGQISLCPPVI